jgi:hypothetical protein
VKRAGLLAERARRAKGAGAALFAPRSLIRRPISPAAFAFDIDTSAAVTLSVKIVLQTGQAKLRADRKKQGAKECCVAQSQVRPAVLRT